MLDCKGNGEHKGRAPKCKGPATGRPAKVRVSGNNGFVMGRAHVSQDDSTHVERPISVLTRSQHATARYHR